MHVSSVDLHKDEYVQDKYAYAQWNFLTLFLSDFLRNTQLM